MSTKTVATPTSASVPPMAMKTANISELLKQYGCGPIPFVGTENAFYERHLVFDRAIDPKVASPRERFEAFSRAMRDILAQRWVRTKTTYEQQNAKRIYYLSLEFLIGRSLTNNIANLRLDPLIQLAVQAKGIDWPELVEQEPDAGLGNGGFGRLHEKVEIKVHCSFELREGILHAVPGPPTTLIGIPFDRPVVGYGGKTI